MHRFLHIQLQMHFAHALQRRQFPVPQTLAAPDTGIANKLRRMAEPKNCPVIVEGMTCDCMTHFRHPMGISRRTRATNSWRLRRAMGKHHATHQQLFCHVSNRQPAHAQLQSREHEQGPDFKSKKFHADTSLVMQIWGLDREGGRERFFILTSSFFNTDAWCQSTCADTPDTHVRWSKTFPTIMK
jgi:hypothetical protein